MNKSQILVCCLLLGTALTARAALDGFSALAAGARYHVNDSAAPDLPFDDGDISYAVAYEYHEAGGLWQLALDWAPHVSGTNGMGTVDYVLTPQINLMFEDRGVRLGVGALASYFGGIQEGNDWTDVYWQMMLGLHLPLGAALALDANAYYVFEEWNKLDKFAAKDLEYGVWLSYRF
jgi:hypothetical protein